MGTNLFAAHNQWANRPADERFESPADMFETCRSYAENARESSVPWDSLTVEADDRNLYLKGPKGLPAKLTHYAFGQLATQAQCPAGFLRSLPPSMAADVMRNRMAAIPSTDRQLLLHSNGSLVARAITSDRYDRVWNHEVVGRIVLPLAADGWKAPPAYALGNDPRARAATEADVMPGSLIKVGDMIAPAGLYASDHDMFAFLIDTSKTIDVDGKPKARGIFVRNSEVGDSALNATFFVHDFVCGNHIVWGAANVHEIRVRHVGKNTMGKALAKWQVLMGALDDSTKEFETTLKAARSRVIASTKDDVLDAVAKFAKNSNLSLLTRKRLDEAYDVAERYTDRFGSPNTVWGMVSGLTQASQASEYADVRNEVDVQAGKILQMAF